MVGKTQRGKKSNIRAVKVKKLYNEYYHYLTKEMRMGKARAHQLAQYYARRNVGVIKNAKKK